jgi:hypothetical protein
MFKEIQDMESYKVTSCVRAMQRERREREGNERVKKTEKNL